MGVKISNLPSIVTPNLTDIFPVVQNGVTYKETCTQLSALLSSVSVSSITGTANQVIASASTGAVTLSLPQSIATSSAVQFSSVALGSGGIRDANTNPIMTISPAVSPVNYFTIFNAATGTNPEIAAIGSDPNIGVNAVTKGTGTFNIVSASLTIPLIMFSGTGSQHQTNFAFSNTSATRTVTFPDASGTAAFTGTLVAGNVVKASSAFSIVDAGFAVLANTTTAWGGGGVSNAFTATGIGATSIVTATILASTNAVSIVKSVPTANTLTVTFSGDPGAATQVSWIAITPAV